MVAIRALYSRLANFDLANFNYPVHSNVPNEATIDPAARKRVRIRAETKLNPYYLLLPVPQLIIVIVGVVSMWKRLPILMIPVMIYCALLYFLYFYGIFLFGYFLLSRAFIHYIGAHIEMPGVLFCITLMLSCAVLSAWSAHAAMSFWSLRDDMAVEKREKTREGAVEHV